MDQEVSHTLIVLLTKLMSVPCRKYLLRCFFIKHDSVACYYLFSLNLMPNVMVAIAKAKQTSTIEGF